MTPNAAMTRPEIGMDLERLRTQVLQMCVRSDSMLQQAVRALVQRDLHLARSVIASDTAMDDLELEIDGACVRYLAVHKPVGYPLRLVTIILKMVTDLERIGDLAGNIAERTLDVGTGPGLEPGGEIPEMAKRATEMIRLAADGFTRDDAGVCADLIARDAELDRLNREAFGRWLLMVQAHPDQAGRALAYSSVCRYLERVGDHCVNLGQMIVLLVEGRDVRHGG